jgi:heme/copper-type cytochrome/quinol oxidase subunit 2
MSVSPFNIFWPFFGAVVIVGLAFLAFNIWMLVDAVQRPAEHFSPPESRQWWIIGLAVGLVLGTLGFVASLLYYFIVRKPALASATFAESLSHRRRHD